MINMGPLTHVVLELLPGERCISQVWKIEVMFFLATEDFLAWLLLLDLPGLLVVEIIAVPRVTHMVDVTHRVVPAILMEA